jgi:hypothetical protein
MGYRLRFASAALTCVVFSASYPASSAAAPPETFATVDRSGGERFPAKPSRPAPSKQINPDDGGPLRGALAVPQTVLTPLKLEQLLAEDDVNARRNPNKILRAGVGRALEIGDYSGNWYDVPNGRVWLGEIVSPGAYGLRVQFVDLMLPKNAELAVTQVGVGDRAERIEWVEADPKMRGEIVAGLVPGERARIEYFAPRGSFQQNVYNLPFRVTGVQHFYRDPLTGEAWAEGAGPCHNDVSCHPAWASAAQAVARVTFVKNGSSFLCSGQLINAQNSDLTPYWLTANHCLSTQAVAATTQFFWRYQTPNCNGTPPALSGVQSSLGATLLATGAATDFTLLMVEGGLPSGLTWVGWTSATVAGGTASASIHHPSGDYKRISFGNKASNTTCGGSQHVRINWTDGPTEGGSSGGGVFRGDTQQLYGQLHCGPSSCGSETSDDYGEFAATYPFVASLLAAGSDDASEQNDSCASARAMATGTHNNRIVKMSDPDWYSISVPAGKTLQATLGFTHSNGDIDAALYTSCSGSPVATGAGTGNTETMVATNNTGAARTYYLRVYLYADTRNGYSLTLGIP